MVRIKAFHYDGLQPKERLAKIKAFWIWISFQKKSFFSWTVETFLDSGLSHNHDRISNYLFVERNWNIGSAELASNNALNYSLNEYISSSPWTEANEQKVSKCQNVLLTDKF